MLKRMKRVLPSIAYYAPYPGSALGYQLIAEGKATKEIAQLLGISAKTAESHRTRLMQKLDIHETASLVRYAIRRGMVQP